MIESQGATGSRPQEDPLAEAPIACHELDRDGRVIWVNEAECSLLGLDREQMLGRHIWDFVSPGEQEASRRAVMRKLAAEEPLLVFERGYERPDGGSLILEIHERYRRDEHGKIAGIRSFLHDITARKRAEAALMKVQEDLELRIKERTEELELAVDFLRREMEERLIAENEQRKLEGQMQHAQRMESVGVLAGGVAHEFNNLLTSIMGYASMAALDVPAASRAKENIDHVLAAAKSAADLTQQMLAYSGRGRFVPGPLDLSDTVEKSARLLESLVSKKAIVKVYLQKGLSPIHADVGQVRQVVINLVTNASDALEDRPGEVVISTGMQWAERGELPSLESGHTLPAGLYVFLEVKDSGSGMDVETLPKIFDPFFTTRFPGRGLGLAAVMGIVRSHKGSIRVMSQRGQGTTMQVLFPAIPDIDNASENAPGESAEPDALEWKAVGAVLVIEDEDPIRNLARAILERCGLSVLAASSGNEGLKLLREHTGEVRAVLLDFTASEGDGAEILQYLESACPDIRIVMCSGYNEQETLTKLSGFRPAAFLRKPYVPAELIRKLRAVW